MSKRDTLELLRLMRMDLSQLQARLTDVQRAIVASDWREASSSSFVCTSCGVRKRNAIALADHRANVHGGDNT